MSSSAVFSQKEQRQNAGTGMGADHSTHMIDMDVLNAAALFQDACQILGILQTVAVGDEHGFVVESFAQL